jgi:hypothetical protein
VLKIKPMTEGAEGLNSGMWDAHNLAWKLALELRGRARPGLIESYGIERLAADRHVLEVSDGLHSVARGAVEAQRTGERGSPHSPEETAALVRARSMLDVSYAGSALVGEHLAGSEAPTGPGPGDRYPDRTTLGGTAHHLLLFGAVDQAAAGRLRDRWEGLLESKPGSGDPRRAGLPRDGGAVLIRPDGHVGFRAAPADRAGLDALDEHLGSYLTPRP